jgi:uncharacterized protein
MTDPAAIYPDVTKRLKRAQGHLKSILAMLDDKRAPLEIVQQLQAVEKAVANAKRSLVHDHIGHSLEGAAQRDAAASGATVQALKELTKYL